MLSCEQNVIEAFGKAYPYLQDTEVSAMYNKALNTYLDLAFPFDTTIIDVPKSRPRAYQWIYDCMVEILERDGASSFVGYSENGLSMSWDSTQISNGLLNRIVGKVGVPQ